MVELNKETEYQKIVLHLLLKGAFKRPSEVERNNPRLNKEFDLLIEKRFLVPNEKGLYDFTEENGIKANYDMLRGLIPKGEPMEETIKELLKIRLPKNVVNSLGNSVINLSNKKKLYET